MPPPGMRRGRGAPALTHHPHSHPGSYQPSEFPGAYPDVESGDDDSGSPGDRMPSPPPGGRMMVPPAGMPPMHPNDPRARQMWDTMAAENMALREDALKMRADMDHMAAVCLSPLKLSLTYSTKMLSIFIYFVLIFL